MSTASLLVQLFHSAFKIPGSFDLVFFSLQNFIHALKAFLYQWYIHCPRTNSLSPPIKLPSLDEKSLSQHRMLWLNWLLDREESDRISQTIKVATVSVMKHFYTFVNRCEASDRFESYRLSVTERREWLSPRQYRPFRCLSPPSQRTTCPHQKLNFEGKENHSSSLWNIHVNKYTHRLRIHLMSNYNIKFESLFYGFSLECYNGIYWTFMSLSHSAKNYLERALGFYW